MRISDWSSDVCSSDLFFALLFCSGRNITKNGRSKRNRRGTRRLSFSISFHLSPLRGTFFEKLSLSPPHGSISLRVARSEELGTLLDLVLDVDHPVEPRVSLLSFVRMTDEALNWIHELVVVLADEIGRAHVCTPVTNAQLVCRL